MWNYHYDGSWFYVNAVYNYCQSVFNSHKSQGRGLVLGRIRKHFLQSKLCQDVASYNKRLTFVMSLTKKCKYISIFLFSMSEQYVFPYLDQNYQNPIKQHAGNMNTVNALWSCRLTGVIFLRSSWKLWWSKIRLFLNWVVMNNKKSPYLVCIFWLWK